MSAQLSDISSRGANALDSPYWTSPEAIRDGVTSPAMDIWSLGIISLELVERYPPYFELDPETARQSIVAKGTPAVKDPNMFTWELLHFLSICLVSPPIDRATAAELSQVSANILNTTPLLTCFLSTNL